MVVVVNVPTEFRDKKYLGAVGLGLHDLAIGKRPDPDMIPLGKTVTARLKLSPKGEEYWNKLLPAFDNNKRRLAREALCLVAQEPDHVCKHCRI